MSTPATAGPMTAGALNATEFNPIAFPMYSRGTISGTQLCRAGESNDIAAEFAALIKINPRMFIQPSGREDRENQREQRHDCIRPIQGAPARKRVGHEPRNRREQQHGNGAAQSLKAEIQRGRVRIAREFRDEVTRRSKLHPRAEIRNQQPDPQQAEIAKCAMRRRARLHASEDGARSSRFDGSHDNLGAALAARRSPCRCTDRSLRDRPRSRRSTRACIRVRALSMRSTSVAAAFSSTRCPSIMW